LVREVRIVGGALFWLSDAVDVFTAAKDGSRSGSLLHANQIDDYFVDGAHVYAWDRERSGAGLLLAAPTGGGGATTLVTGVITAAPVVAGGAADGNGVIYWSGGYGPAARGLLETSKTGGATSAVWSGQPGFAVVADDACVYWIAGQDVLRVAK
jgi:hypothetical protein